MALTVMFPEIEHNGSWCRKNGQQCSGDMGGGANRNGDDHIEAKVVGKVECAGKGHTKGIAGGRGDSKKTAMLVWKGDCGGVVHGRWYNRPYYALHALLHMMSRTSE